jgi:cytochrome P450
MNSTLPAGPKQSPVRQLIEMGAHPFSLLDRCRRDYGDVFTLRMFGQGPFVLFGEHEAVRWIFSQPRSAFTHANDLVGIVIGDRSVLFMDGEEHRRERHLLMPVFHGERMRSYGAIMREAAERELARWPQHDTVIVRPGMVRITLEVICRCLFGQTDGVHSERLQHQVERFLDAAQTPALFMAGTVIPRTRIRVLLQRRTDVSLPVRLLSSVPRTLLWREVADSPEKICQAVAAEIAACRAGDPGYEGTILRMLTAAKDEAGTGLTDEEINDEVLTLLMAGHETTATTLAWGLYHLAANPAAQQRLFEELSQSFPEGAVDPDRAGKLPYLTAVVNETLRLTPIAVAVPRRLREAVTLAGHHLPAGTNVGASIYVAHRSRAWERPDDFEPERFLTGSPSPFVFFPFGGGTRRCVGAEFARYQLAVVLGQLILSREFNLVPSYTMRPYMRGATVAPHPRMPLQVRSRPGC